MDNSSEEYMSREGARALVEQINVVAIVSVVTVLAGGEVVEIESVVKVSMKVVACRQSRSIAAVYDQNQLRCLVRASALFTISLDGVDTCLVCGRLVANK